jgi:2,4-dienoyl-CoA reductase-like NADH-dependent reductase (Old Yellow Enzyme family)
MQALRVKIASRGGKARARTLSPGRRSEIASWARFVRKSKAAGQPITEQIARTIQIVRAENPDLASFLKVTSCMPKKYAERLCKTFSDEEKQIIERAWQRVVSE